MEKNSFNKPFGIRAVARQQNPLIIIQRQIGHLLPQLSITTQHARYVGNSTAEESKKLKYSLFPKAGL